MNNLVDKVVAITGAGSGSGRATAIKCARKRAQEVKRQRNIR